MGVYYGLHGPSVGPSIVAPEGKTSLSNSTTSSSSLSTETSVVPLGSPSGSSTSSSVALTSTSLAPIGTTTLTPVTTTTVATSTTQSPMIRLASYSSQTSASTTVGSSTRTALSYLARSRPIHLSIPAIGVSTSLSTLGLNANRTVQVPTNVYQAGWYKYGPTPGQEGSAVILGHVDTTKGPAVFYRLIDLKVGDRIYVTLANRKQVVFSVIGVRQYLKAKFPDQLVYGPRTYSALQLVTCGGSFDSSTGHYLSNIVVFSARVH